MVKETIENERKIKETQTRINKAFRSEKQMGRKLEKKTEQGGMNEEGREGKKS